MRPYIVGFGIACIDYIVVSPRVEHGGHTHVTELAVHGGGLTGTAIVAAARLGARTRMLGRLGDDDIGDQVVAGLQADGVDASGLIRVPGGRSLVSVVIVDQDTAERTIYCRSDVGTDCSPDLIDLGALKGADALVLDAHWADGARAVARRAGELGVPIVCDINPKPENVDIISLCDYPIVNRASALKFAGTDDHFEALERIRALGPKAAVITCGPDGAYYSDGVDRDHMPAFRIDAVDTTGAGDVFHGAFAFGLTQGWELREVVRFASAVSAIKCTRLGGRAGIPTFDQTMEFLKSRG